MKILFNTYPMAFHTPGGGEAQLIAYQKHLTQLNVEVDLFDLWKPNFLNYDIVHFFSVIGGSWHFCNFVRQLKLPLFINSSLWVTEETKHLYPFDEIKLHLHLADRVITNSVIENEQITSLFDLSIEKCTVVYNGIDSSFLEPVPPDIFRKNYDIHFPFILNVGNIEPRKNQLNLLLAMQKFKDLKLVTIGHIRDKAYAKECLAVASDRWICLNALPHDDPLLRSAYSAAEVFVLPSTLETPGLAALEAAAQGTPIVITAIGAAKEYFGEHALYVTHPEDPDEIAALIEKAITAKKSKTTLIEHVKQFTWEETLRPLVEIYKQEIIL